MVNYMLMIAAELENLTDLQPQGGCDDPNFTYYFKLKCGNCGEVTQKETCVSLNETVPSAKGRSDVHLAQKCKFCSREGTVTMIAGRGSPLTQDHAEAGKYAPVMLFDFRGFEPVDFVFGSGWKAESKSKDGTSMEIMVTQQRRDLLMNIPALRKLDAMLIGTLDNFVDQHELWYVSKDADESEKGVQRNEKWWLPTVKVPRNGLSEESRQFLQKQKEAVNQVLKASMAINAQILSDMEIPENYIESLPKNGRSSLGDLIYKSITVEFFDPQQFLSTMDLSSEHKVLDLKNRIEASIVIWERKMQHKVMKSGWGSAVSLEKRDLFEERAETILLLLKHQFPGLPQSSLDISKIQYNKDVGHSILESYSRVLKSLANTVMSCIEDVLYADSLAQDPSLAVVTWKPSMDSTTTSPTLSSFPSTGEETEIEFVTNFNVTV